MFCVNRLFLLNINVWGTVIIINNDNNNTNHNNNNTNNKHLWKINKYGNPQKEIKH